MLLDAELDFVFLCSVLHVATITERLTLMAFVLLLFHAMTFCLILLDAGAIHVFCKICCFFFVHLYKVL